MPAKRKYQPQCVLEKPIMPGTLPVDRPIAVYCRQSSMAQVVQCFDRHATDRFA